MSDVVQRRKCVSEAAEGSVMLVVPRLSGQRQGLSQPSATGNTFLPKHA